jgi:Flp pilus assembly protein TadG
MRRARGSALLEFALVWPVVLLATLAAVQLGIWSAAAFSARAAALTAAHAGAAAGGSPSAAVAVAVPALRAAMPATSVVAWCPPGTPPPGVWVCATAAGAGFEVVVGGAVSELVPLLPDGGGLGVHADVVMPYERFK